MRTLVLLTALALLFSGCTSEDNAADALDADGQAAASADPEPFLLDWDGHVVAAPLDILMHQRPTEDALFTLQPAGFSLEIPEAPAAIEVMVAWDGPGAFVLHPHYVVEEGPNAGGTSTYYGYHSGALDQSPACIRIPQADMAAGKWQMMIHPAQDDMVDVPFTMTVGIQGAQGTVLDEMHGHRADGPSDIQDHGWDPCQFLVPADEPAGEA
ncbi:MAG: hypothetical protein ACPGQL_04705 [Thermoplasmatota archaeon]